VPTFGLGAARHGEQRVALAGTLVQIGVISTAGGFVRWLEGVQHQTWLLASVIVVLVPLWALAFSRTGGRRAARRPHELLPPSPGDLARRRCYRSCSCWDRRRGADRRGDAARRTALVRSVDRDDGRGARARYARRSARAGAPTWSPCGRCSICSTPRCAPRAERRGIDCHLQSSHLTHVAPPSSAPTFRSMCSCRPRSPTRLATRSACCFKRRP